MNVSRFKKKFSVKGQSLVQFAILLGIVGLAILTMQAYVKRGIQARVKTLTDSIVGTEQRPYIAVTETSNTDTYSNGPSTLTVATASGGSLTKTVSDSVTSRSSSTSVGKY